MLPVDREVKTEIPVRVSGAQKNAVSRSLASGTTAGKGGCAMVIEKLQSHETNWHDDTFAEPWYGVCAYVTCLLVFLCRLVMDMS